MYFANIDIYQLVIASPGLPVPAEGSSTVASQLDHVSFKVDCLDSLEVLSGFSAQPVGHM